MRKTFYLLLGLLAGAVVGVAAAILLAPYSGTELQRRMREQLGVVQARIQEIIEEGRRAAAARTEDIWAQFEAAKRGASLSPESTSDPTQV